jgi:hypothetical protein
VERSHDQRIDPRLRRESGRFVLFFPARLLDLGAPLQPHHQGADRPEIRRRLTHLGLQLLRPGQHQPSVKVPPERIAVLIQPLHHRSPRRRPSLVTSPGRIHGHSLDPHTSRVHRLRWPPIGRKQRGQERREHRPQLLWRAREKGQHRAGVPFQRTLYPMTHHADGVRGGREEKGQPEAGRQLEVTLEAEPLLLGPRIEPVSLSIFLIRIGRPLHWLIPSQRRAVAPAGGRYP